MVSELIMRSRYFACLAVFFSSLFLVSAATFADLDSSKADSNKDIHNVKPLENQTANDKISVKKTTTAKKEDAFPHKEFPVDVTEMFELTLHGKIRRDRHARRKKGTAEEGQEEYLLTASLKNISGETVPGPLRLVIEETGLKNLIPIKGDGRLKSGLDYVEYIGAEKRIHKGRKTRRKTLTFASIESITADDLKNIDLVWSVTREESTPYKARQNPDLFNKLMAKKSYSYRKMNAAMQATDQFSQNVLKKDHKELLGKEIYSVATAENKKGELVIQVGASRLGIKKNLPRTYGGFKVVVDARSRYEAKLPGEDRSVNKANKPLQPLPENSSKEVRETLQSTVGDPQIKHVRPVPIGVSISNVTDVCVSGTLGCRCTKNGGGGKVILTNNHVIGKENTATTGEIVLQPSRGDSNCTTSTANEVGKVDQVVPITFTGVNRMDATTATTTVADTDSCTPSVAYGFPDTSPIVAVVGMKAQKYGRTSGFRRGIVTEINATAFVMFDAGVAEFDQQIIFQGTNGKLGQAGDSGSLIVSDPGKRPIALLFAGGANDTVGNPIQDILARLNLTIDGDSGGTTPPPATKASIGDRVFADANSDGIQNPGELGVPNITVELFTIGADNLAGTADDALVATKVTSPSGLYQFEDVNPNTYFVKFTLASVSQAFTTQDTGTDDNIDSDADPTTGMTAGYTVAAGESITHIDAGITNAGSVAGKNIIGNRVWFDLNKDGRQGVFVRPDGKKIREPGADGVRIQLYDAKANKLVKETVSNGRGFYKFIDVSSGDYFLKFSKPAGHNYAEQNVPGRGGRFKDSDADSTGKTATFTIEGDATNYSYDCGFTR